MSGVDFARTRCVLYHVHFALFIANTAKLKVLFVSNSVANRSNHTMSWEVVKGFCRRRTQQLRENFQNAPKTEDAEFDSSLANAEATVVAVEKMSQRLTSVLRDLTDFIQQYEFLQADLSSPAIQFHTELQGMDKKIELATQDYKIKFTPLQVTIQQCLEQLRRFHTEATQIECAIEDRKTKMLELDFFRNKLVGLRASPPADTSRIPRNEAREMEWQRAYDDSNAQAKKLFQHLIKSGGELTIQGANILAVDVSRFFGEVSKTQRILFLGSRLTDEAANAMTSVQQAATSLVQQAPAAIAAISLQPSASGGSKRYFSADDPFKT